MRAGVLLAVLGPNGDGKTTALSMLTGLSAPTSGTARLFGTDPRDLAARQRIGVMLQSSGVPSTLRVGELLTAFRGYYPAPLPFAAVVEAARRNRTGRDDAAATTSGFEDQVCANIGGDYATCRSRTTISVNRYTRFADANAVAANQPDGSFNKGGPGDIIVVKVAYRWPLLIPYLGQGVDRDGPTDVIIPARATFKNEPYA